MQTSLKPSEIRFIQDTINNVFQQGGYVNDRAEDLCNGRVSANVFPAISVCKRSNKYYSFDNRRLYVFRVAEYRGVISNIKVNLVDESRLDMNRFTTKNDGRTVEVRRGRTLSHCKSSWLRQTLEISSRVALVHSPTTPKPLSTPKASEPSRPDVRISISDDSIEDDDFMRPSRSCPCTIM